MEAHSGEDTRKRGYLLLLGGGQIGTPIMFQFGFCVSVKWEAHNPSMCTILRHIPKGLHSNE